MRHWKQKILFLSLLIAAHLQNHGEQENPYINVWIDGLGWNHVSQSGSTQNSTQNNSSGFSFSMSHATEPQSGQFFSNEKELKSALAIAYIKAHTTPEQFKEFCNKLHIAKYGVNQEQLKHLRECYPEYVKNWIEKNSKKLTRSQILNTAWDHCNHAYWPWNKKKEYQKFVTIYEQQVQRNQEIEQKKEAKQLAKTTPLPQPLPIKKESIEQKKLNESLLKRQIKNQSLQTLQDLQQEYQVSACSHQATRQEILRHQQLKQALKQTIDQDYAQHDKSFEINPQTQGYLHSLGFNPIEYLNMHGTPLQHQLHEQTCQIFDQAAMLQIHLSHDSSMLKQSVLCADAAHSANVEEQIRLTLALNHVAQIPFFSFGNDLASEFARLGSIATEQFIHSTLHAINPVEILHGISSMLHILIDPFRVENACQSKHNPLEELQHFSHLLQAKHQQRSKAMAQCLHDTLQSLDLWYQHRPLEKKSEDLVRGFVDIGTNFVVPDIVISKIAIALGCVAGNMRSMGTLEGCASGLAEQLGFEEIAQELSQVTRELEASTQQNLGQKIAAEFMEIEAQISKSVESTNFFNKSIYKHYLNQFSEKKDDLIHMFRDKPGKLKDTPINRKRILEMVKDENKCFGQDEYGVVSYAAIESDGTQLWAEINPETYRIRNCGFNELGKHRQWCQETGFKSPSNKIR